MARTVTTRASRLAVLLAFAGVCRGTGLAGEAPGAAAELDASTDLETPAEGPKSTSRIQVLDTRHSVSIGARAQAIDFGITGPDGLAETGYLSTRSFSFGAEIVWEDSLFSYYDDNLLFYSTYGRRWGLDVYYYDRTSFEFDQSEQNPGEVVYYEPDDLHVRGYGVSGHYVLLPGRFSFPAGYGLAERQTASGGSPVLYAAMSGQNVRAGDSLIPPQLQADFGKLGTIEGMDFFCVTAAVGYAHCFVVGEGRYMLGSVILGYGGHSRDLDTGSGGGVVGASADRRVDGVR
jgi:hypothetical protein